MLVVRVRAPAIDGRANESLCRIVAKQLRVPGSPVTIVRGSRSRDKALKIDGIDQPALIAALKIEITALVASHQVVAEIDRLIGA